MKWNTALYDDKHDFVAKYGEDVVVLLAPQEGEEILDIGCGTGDLTALIAESGARVRGLDSSPEMVERASAKYPQLSFELKSADDFHYDQPFDAIFSNATLHWVLQKERAVRCIYEALKPGGRFVAEFGGKGNVKGIEHAVKQALISLGHADRAETKVWYFPSLGTYATLLEKQGFHVQFAAHFQRETTLKAESGIRGWLQQFASPFLQDLNNDTVANILSAVEEQLRPTHYKDPHWVADYVRLRIVAVKPVY